MKPKNLLIFVSVFLLLVSCATPTPVTVVKTVVIEKLITPVPEPIKNVTNIQVPLGWLNNDEFVALQVAQAKGFYNNNGLGITLISGGGSTGMDPIVAINGMDDNMRIGVPAALSLVLKAYAQGIDVIAIAAISQYEPGGFIALTKNGNQAKSPCDFKGKVVAMQTEAQWYVDALGAVCDKGPLVSGKDFTVVPAGWTPDCLLSGQCDFYCGWSTNQPFMLEQQGYKEDTDYEFFLASDFLPFYYSDVIVTTKAYIKDHPEIVKAFVAASMQGLQYTLDNPEDAIAIASMVPGVDPAHAAWRTPAQNKIATSSDTQVDGVGYMSLAKVQEMIDFLYKYDQIPKSFKAEEVINNSFLPGQ
jgi:NitT/TauT family transport system substrate-binding protein